MGAILSSLSGPVIKILGVFVLIAAVCGGGYILMLKYDDMAQTVKAAQADKATAEANTLTAINAANGNALLLAQVQKQGDLEVQAVTAQKDAAVQRANTSQAMLKEIQNAPHTSNCARSAVISDTLERLRSAQAARDALADSGEAGTSTNSTGDASDVPAGPSGSAQGQ